MCESGLVALQKKLAKISSALQANSGWSQKLRSQFQRALYPFKESTIVKLKEICSDLQGNLALALETLQIDSTSISLETLGVIQNDVSEISLDIKSLDRQLTQASTRVGELHSFQKGKIHHQQLPTIDYSLTMCGAGKTVLASFIVNALQAVGNEHVGVAYIYCNYSEAEKQNPTNLLKSILLQLASRKRVMIEELTEAYKKHMKEGTALSLPECCRLLHAATNYFSKIYLVIDALDECAECTRDILLAELKKPKPQINVLVTSRHVFPDHYDAESALRLEIEANMLDIREYLEKRITESSALQAYFKKDMDLHDVIISDVAERAKGMFLLARLHLDSLMASLTLRKVKAALRSLPEELDRTYEQVLQRIQAQDPDRVGLALKVLGWIHHAARPLGTRELQHALAVESGDSQFDEDGIPDIGLVLSVCAGIVEVRENNTMGLVHYTAQEYLKRRAVDLFPDAQMEIATTCLIYLSFDEFAQGPSPNDKAFDDRMELCPLLPYASRYWVRHARGNLEAGIKALALAFLKQDSKVASSTQVSEAFESRHPMYSQRFRHNVRGLWFAASNGLYDLTVALLEDAASIEAEDFEGERSLHRAAINGHYDITLLLLEHQANVHAMSHSGATALHYAATHGHQQIVRLLTEKGAVVGACDKKGWTALHLAASNGHRDISELLLDRGADIQSKDGYGATALYRAAEKGHYECTLLLVERGAHLDVKNDYDQTALHRAAENGHLPAAEILLEHGADCTIKDFYGWTPKYRAADMGHDDIVRLILKFLPRPLAQPT
ncbi:MAG: hypothetical protein ASARMPREDX12_000073 [Alectoria sarmentosa]|nr:MAG: hypothetical protein ASARMPREDX12_000073 [Alectoria sarmentosa]